MYIFISLLFVFLLFFLVIYSYRKKCMVHKICSLSLCEKADMLNALIEPMGFQYDLKEDIFTSNVNAWQRELGYHAVFDRAAVHFNMVFDYQSVYFNYLGRTWMIEFWKGQYGINTGSEIGIYYADSIIPQDARPFTHFQSVPDFEMLPLTIELCRNETTLFCISRLHWWLTGFDMGIFSYPYELDMRISITFPDCAMTNAFIGGLKNLSYRNDDYFVCGTTISFILKPTFRRYNLFYRLSARFSQWKNRLLVKLFLCVTAPFCSSLDRILYLYYFLPPLFRRTMNIRRCHRKYIRRYCKKSNRRRKR